jgi:hypothetical protein
MTMKSVTALFVCFAGVSVMAMECDMALSDTTVKTIFPYTVPEYRDEMLVALQELIGEFGAKRPLNLQHVERLVLQQAKLSYPEIYKAYQERRAIRRSGSSDHAEGLNY